MRPDALLLVAQAGRGLARAALRAGHPAVGMDAFADRDTCDLALAWERAPLGDDGEFEAEALVAAAERLCPPDRCAGLVYGAGFEASPALLARLARGRRLFGNSPEVLARVNDPADFAATLARLGLPHPETRETLPGDAAGWLAKRRGGRGGIHVQPATPAAELAETYFQRRLEGVACSLLFLAAGGQIRAVGFNRLLVAPPEAPGAWAYSGAVAPAGLPRGLVAEVIEAARRLAGEYGLVGLNGIDFLVAGEAWHLLELNARPTATLELWDQDPQPALLDLHLAACRGELPDGLAGPAGGRAVAVAYAGEKLRVPAGFPWPDWCADLPRGGSSLSPGAPVCSVTALAGDAAGAEALATARRRAILDRLAAPMGRPATALFPESARTAPPRHV